MRTRRKSVNFKKDGKATALAAARKRHRRIFGLGREADSHHPSSVGWACIDSNVSRGADLEHLTLKDMMASVGYLLLHWGQLEHRLDGRPIPEKLEAIRRLRNTLCHCLIAAHGEPMSEPFVVCAIGATEVRHTWTEVDEAIRTLERFRGVDIES